MTTEMISEYADAVMVMIDEDIDEGVIPWGLTEYSSLHDHVDANDYLLHAGVPYGKDIPEGQDPNGIWVEVEEEVQRRLRERRGTCTNENHDHGMPCKDCGKPVYYDQIIEAYQHSNDGACDCFLIRRHADATPCDIPAV